MARRLSKRDEARSLDAAERALGLVRYGRETKRDVVLREEWEQRFSSLGRLIPPVEPPEGLFRAVEARIEMDAAVEAANAATAHAGRWRAAAFGLGGIAALFALFIAMPQPDTGERFVAVVYSDAEATRPGMIVQFDTLAGVATIIPMPLERETGTSFEMWHLPEGEERPFSIGLLPEAPLTSRQIRARPGDIFAISREPAGGSPSGQPTEALFHGTVTVVE
ncbi:MAG: anti-sigma factor [Pseudomonadota bacterium]